MMFLKKQLGAIATYFPEIILTGIIFWYWLLSGTFFNPVPIVLLGIVGYQIIKNTSRSGLFISGLFFLLTGYMFLAIISEVNNSQSHEQAHAIFAFGAKFLVAMLVGSSLMFLKYIKREINKGSLA